MVTRKREGQPLVPKSGVPNQETLVPAFANLGSRCHTLQFSTQRFNDHLISRIASMGTGSKPVVKEAGFKFNDHAKEDGRKGRGRIEYQLDPV